MLGSGAMVESDMPGDLMQKVRGVCASFEAEIRKDGMGHIPGKLSWSE